MLLIYPNKKTPEQIYHSIPDCSFAKINHIESENKLIEGDNLLAMKKLLTSYGLAESVDLIYIDPPFSSNHIFTITESRANTISRSNTGEIAYTDTLKLEEFLEFLRHRLILLKMLLSKQGSIYVHTDYKIGHYVKIIMDEIFGLENFRNDISRIKCNPKNFSRKAYGNIKDLVLFYSKSNTPIWNEPRDEYSQDDQKKLFAKVDEHGRSYTTIPLHAPGETQHGKTAQPFKGIYPPSGRHWRTDVATMAQWDAEGLIEWSSSGNPRKKIFFDEQTGKRIQDIWEFKDPQKPVYPTEKNPNLLELIIRTSSNPESIVLDCFCGSGTTLVMAQQYGRRWIGIDASAAAIHATIKKLARLNDDLFEKISYEYVKLL